MAGTTYLLVHRRLCSQRDRRARLARSQCLVSSSLIRQTLCLCVQRYGRLLVDRVNDDDSQADYGGSRVRFQGGGELYG